MMARLCEQTRQENRGKWCWGCSTFTHGEIGKRCFNSSPDCRGCAQVNRRFNLASANEIPVSY